MRPSLTKAPADLQPGPEQPPDGAPDRREDLHLMTLVAAGDTGAQQALVLRLMDRVRRLSQTLLGNAADSDDAAQLALVAVLQAARGYRGESSLERWADRIAVRTAMRVARERRVRALAFEPDETLEVLAVPSHDGDAHATQDMEELLAELPVVLRDVLVLRHVVGHSVDEIAELCGVSPNTVKDRLLRAREQLRKRVRRERVIDEANGRAR